MMGAMRSSENHRNTVMSDQLAPSELIVNIVAYERMQSDLEGEHAGEWVLFHEGKLVDTFKSFGDAAVQAVAQFGRGPYLIRQIGSGPFTLPTSASYNPVLDCAVR